MSRRSRRASIGKPVWKLLAGPFEVLLLNAQYLHEMNYSLVNGRIDIWPVHVSVHHSVVQPFHKLLGPEESARVSTFRFEHLRQRNAVIHGILRILLGRYLNEDPSKLEFSAEPKGKPKLNSPGRIEFNISHSDDIALFGFTLGCGIGVDVERVRPMGDVADIFRRFFCPEETDDLMSLDPGERHEAFFRCWTRKEAFLKAVGDGLQRQLDSFRVSFRPLEAARLLWVDGSSEIAAMWTLQSIDSVPLCMAALAYPSPPREVRLLPLLSPANFLVEHTV